MTTPTKPFTLDSSGVAALRDETVSHAKQAAADEVQALLDNAVVTKDADGLKVLVIPRNAVVVFPDPGDEGARDRIHGAMRDRIDHDAWIAAFVAEGDVVAVLGSNELVTALRATMADEVRADLIEAARDAAAETVSTALAAHAVS